jgi:hypothetical protein
VDEGLWRKRDVMILDLPLEDYIGSLKEALVAKPKRGRR